MTAAVLTALKLGNEREDLSFAALLVDARMYQDVYCPELNGKKPIARIYREELRGRATFYPEICHSTVNLGSADTLDEALGAIAQAIDI